MDQITGLPAHPLFVHIPVTMLPLAFAGVVVMLIRTAWYERYRWAVLVIADIGILGAILAASSGESLERQIREREGAEAANEIHDHIEAGNLARTIAIVFFVVLALYVIVPWFLDRRASRSAEQDRVTAPTWVRPVLMVAVAIAAAASTITVVDAGHSGASSAWDEYDTSPDSSD